jgi:hypothetical protein
MEANMLTHDYIALQMTKARRDELIQESKQENLLKFAMREAKVQLQERLERARRNRR